MIALKIIALLVWVMGSFYFLTPEINIQNPSFIVWLGVTLLGFTSLFFFTSNSFDRGKESSVKTKIGVVLTIIFSALLVLYFCLGFISSATIFNAEEYSNQLEYEMSTIEEFGMKVPTEDIETNQLPIVDYEMAKKLAEGCLGKYGSQYTLGDESSTLIHVNTPEGERLVRVFPLEYSGFFVALKQRSEGTVGYVVVDVVTSETKLVELEKGMEYTKNSLGMKNLERYIWMNYPTAMVTDYSFEIDDEGNPYWVATYVDKEVGLYGGETPEGVIIVDAESGEIEQYPMGEEPEWVDRVVPVDIAMEQATKALMYQEGFANAHFGAKKNVYTLTGDYDYMMIDGKTYMYAGITSPNAKDATSVGFILVDLKTMETIVYPITGITEARAQDIAETQQEVKAQKLNASSPLLVNMNGTPTYFMTLKNGYQVQWYCFVRVSDGKIALDQDLSKAKSEYLSMISNDIEVDENEMLTMTGTVSRVYNNTEQDTMEFVFEENPSKQFNVPLELGTQAKYLQSGDVITVKYVESGDGTAQVKEITNQTLMSTQTAQ